MATAESRPFRTPSASAVLAQLHVVSPSSDVEHISDTWGPGDDVVIRGVATLTDDFWADTGIEPHEDVWLVAVATCTPARIRWRAQSRFKREGSVWSTELELTATGADLAVALSADLWVVGPGRTGNPNPDKAVHRSAKLWQMPEPLLIPLERDGSDFPTSALSFSATGRRAVPWLVETVPDAEPHWSISSAIRLYINTDLDICRQIADGTAGHTLYGAIECDIHLATLHLLGGWSDSIGAIELESLAEGDHRSMAALGLSISTSLGLTVDEGCRLAREDPLTLASRSREALNLFQRRDT